ncbi:hypothetical protein C5B42_01880 [Candidatus Cerribacteria bacterium 'Amazon FNV 2010 28 9']|uniref:Isopentenyl phosphate kinase n=1 Tax=Candidatus Cerribacteria bacterium 'Amazon FNV 2010 28 9' TaxID=2081795 RepID=A0A317JS00_9BACT|nr:MAG: hypothetical protein C5B42_01880 [Candidatus Cerribacteria bacterium 'Amazon FNV 2010 28 9']
MSSSLVFLKLGGAVITNKDIPESVREGVLSRLIGEIARARKEKDMTLVLGNGAGSFAHVPAARYKTMDGFIHPESRMGMAITQDAAARLNRIVVNECLKHEIPALTLAPSNTLVTSKKEMHDWCGACLETYLEQGMVPVTYGDVLADTQQGCTIWSTDKVFAFLARQCMKKGMTVSTIIHVTEAEGVWKSGVGDQRLGDRKPIYPIITSAMQEEVKAAMVDTKGFDVTGGMWHKIEESLLLANEGIQTRIISGLVKDNVYKVLMGDEKIGTTIR